MGKGSLECIVLTEVTWRGRITCSPTPMRNFSGAKGIGSIKSQTSLFLSSFFHPFREIDILDPILNKKKNRVDEYRDTSFLVNQRYVFDPACIVANLLLYTPFLIQY